MTAPRPAGTAAAEPLDPAALLRDLQDILPELGITRVAVQTGLDRTGIDCCSAIRPNSATVATHQGKGLDPVSAEISAIMEAAEYALAESPAADVLRLSFATAEALGYAPVDFRNLMPHGWNAGDEPSDWLAGEWLGEDEPALAPLEAIRIGTVPVDFPGISQSTNGLAAGPSRDHALLHALLELVERDAMCLWGFRRDAAALARCFAPAALDDPITDALVERLAQCGFRLNLFDLTSDIGVPVVYAVLAEAEGASRHFDASTGAGCHPVATIAARRAIVEAAQTRISIIAGARDDIEAADYDASLSRDIAVLAAPLETTAPPPVDLSPAPAGMLATVRAALAGRGLGRVAVIPLGGENLGINVLRAFVPGLEDRLTNRNWRAGPRAARAMLGLL